MISTSKQKGSCQIVLVYVCQCGKYRRCCSATIQQFFQESLPYILLCRLPHGQLLALLSSRNKPVTQSFTWSHEDRNTCECLPGVYVVSWWFIPRWAWKRAISSTKAIYGESSFSARAELEAYYGIHCGHTQSGDGHSLLLPLAGFVSGIQLFFRDRFWLPRYSKKREPSLLSGWNFLFLFPFAIRWDVVFSVALTGLGFLSQSFCLTCSLHGCYTKRLTPRRSSAAPFW